jgi:Fungal specific transcription factor domain
LWVGLLFSIIGLAVAVNQATEEGAADTGSQGTLLAKTLRKSTAQCLVMGNYVNSTSYAVEAMLLLFLSKYVGKPDSSFNGWFLMGNIIRLAMRMGYHRDPRNRRDISPFEGEMRRRRWHSILQLDLLLSFQMGMPSMIPAECSDTELPRNFNDADIYPNIESLPSPRPLSDYTPVLYVIVKGGIMNVFRKVMAHTQSSVISPPPYPMTLELDHKLRDAYAKITDDFKMKPISQSIIDSSSIIINRCTVELLFLKGLMVLHRQYLNTDRLDAQYDYSRRACIDAALTILSRQADLHQATQPYGRLYADRWMVSSLTAHDFLLASMVICLELSQLIRSPITTDSSLINSPSRFSKLLDALLDSQRIWASRSVFSREARTASLTLQLMIDKVQGNNSHYKQTSSSDGDVDTNAFQNVMTFSSLGEGDEVIELPFAGTMTDMIDGSENLDWVSCTYSYLHMHWSF